MNNWTANLLLLFSIGAACGAAYLWMYLKKKEARKFPFSDDVLRVPGQGLSEKMNDLSFDLALYFGLVPLVPVLIYAIYLQSLSDNGRQIPGLAALILLFIAAGTVSYLIIRIFRILGERHAYQLGYAGEVAVAGSLNELIRDGYYIFHDVQTGRKFNIDHIAVGPGGVFSIETKVKTKSKKVEQKMAYKVTYDGEALCFPDKKEYRQKDYIEQAERGAKWVSKWLSSATGMPVKVTPVLVMPGWYIERKRPGGILVLNHNQLMTLVGLNKSRLAQEEINRIVYQIKQKCLDEKIMPKLLRD